MKASLVGRQIKGITDDPFFDLDTWPTVDEGAIPEKHQLAYLQRKLAVKLYLDGAPEQEIVEAAHVGCKQISRLIKERCLLPHPDGSVYGWRGLLKHTRVNAYQRKHAIKIDVWGRGSSGVLNDVFLRYPLLKKSFDKRILNGVGRRKLGEVNRTKQSLWRWFINGLREKGAETRGEWPFNTARLGLVSVTKYINDVYAANPKKAAMATGGPDGAKKLKTGDGVNRPQLRAFQRVEADGHKLDGRFCVNIPQPTGGWSAKIVYRLWVLVIIEVVSRAVLGYHFSINRELRKEDVLKAIRNSLSRWRPKKNNYCETAYHSDAGFPSSYDERFVGACWDQFSVDGALVNICKTVEEPLRSVVQASILSPQDSDGYSARRSMDDRPFIEAFFTNLGKRGLQRLSNTTGGKPSDKQGRNPDQVALASEFQLEYAQELIDVLIANYNGTPHSSLGYRSPLAYLDFMTATGRAEIRHADAQLVTSLLSYRKVVTVLGGYDSGRLPYINFEGARYSADWLANRHDLCGKKLSIATINDEDVRVVQASGLDGLGYGFLRALPPWHSTPHSLSVRKAIRSLHHRCFESSR